MDEMTKRLIKEASKNSTRGDFFHSSSYAKVGQGSHIGASSTQTFKQRQKLAHDFVGKYGDARLNSDARSHHANTNSAQPIDSIKSTGTAQPTVDNQPTPSIGAQRWADLQAAKSQRPQNPKK